MNRFIRIFLIGAILAFFAYNLFRSTCPPAGQIIAHWKKDNEEYQAGKISFDELIYRSDRLIECRRDLPVSISASRCRLQEPEHNQVRSRCS